MEIKENWDKVFKKSDKVNHEKVTFKNRFGIDLVADLYIPKTKKESYQAISIAGPFGGVKEQASGLYAQTLAEKGFITLAFDPSFTGESGGIPRYMASPDINAEDFQASIDYLSNHPLVDKEKIGIIGICGWASIALKAAALDTRIKAITCVTMYDMHRLNRNGYFDEEDNEEARYLKKVELNHQRTIDFLASDYKRAGGVSDFIASDAPKFQHDYYDYYKTPRGFHERSLNSTEGWNVIGCMSYINTPVLTDVSEIRSAIYFIHGASAHSCYFTQDAYKEVTNNSKYKDNKKLELIEGAVHTDLYDNLDIIPFDNITNFFNTYLK